MGSIAAAEQLHKRSLGAHIILLKASVQDVNRARANDMGIGFMAKPLTVARIHQLMAVLET